MRVIILGGCDIIGTITRPQSKERVEFSITNRHSLSTTCQYQERKKKSNSFFINGSELAD